VWPVVARAQQPAVPVMGYLDATRPGLRSVDTIVAAFRAGLAETGYVEGRNVALEFRWAEGQIDRLPALAADLARRQVAMIIAGGSAAAHAALAAARNNVPAVYTASFFVRDGGLLSYGSDYGDIFRRAATYVDRILRGAKPAELPVQFPTKFELVINLKTAKALGLTIPETLLATADEVIQ
jgi:ABC-type uncharacterized transport system substrate-binding protein